MISQKILFHCTAKESKNFSESHEDIFFPYRTTQIAKLIQNLFEFFCVLYTINGKHETMPRVE